MFYAIFYRPLLNALVLLINFLPFHDIGFAVVFLTILVRLIIYPFTHSASLMQRKMKEIEPELKDIKEKFKTDTQEQAKRTMELYKKHGINPFSSFLALLIQLPIIFALYRVFIGGVKFNPVDFYSFVSIPSSFNLKFLGLVDMTKTSYFLAALAAITQFFQTKLMMPSVPVPSPSESGKSSFKDDLARSMNLQVKYVMPVLMFFIALKFSSAVALYLTTMNIFAIFHEVIVARKVKK